MPNVKPMCYICMIFPHILSNTRMSVSYEGINGDIVWLEFCQTSFETFQLHCIGAAAFIFLKIKIHKKSIFVLKQ